jgi:hypothetical protein
MSRLFTHGTLAAAGVVQGQIRRAVEQDAAGAVVTESNWLELLVTLAVCFQATPWLAEPPVDDRNPDVRHEGDQAGLLPVKRIAIDGPWNSSSTVLYATTEAGVPRESLPRQMWVEIRPDRVRASIGATEIADVAVVRDASATPNRSYNSASAAQAALTVIARELLQQGDTPGSDRAYAVLEGNLRLRTGRSEAEDQNHSAGVAATTAALAGGHPRLLPQGPYESKLTATYFVSRYSAIPSGPPSRPKPECLMPPNGAAALDTIP